MRTTPPPNILLLFTDQLRADCLAAWGNSKIKTPNIDRLSREGTSFTRCYTPSPVCLPARHSLTCGLPPHITGCVDNVDVKEKTPSFMEKLGECGYQTHGVGKMHFSSNMDDWGLQSRDTSEEILEAGKKDDYKSYLDSQGYNHVIDPHGLRSELYYTPQPSQLPEKLHHSHWVADRSIDFLNTRAPDKPFFLWSSFIKPHPPFETPNPWGRLYRMHEMDEPLMAEGDEDHSSFWSKIQNRYKYMDGGPYDRNRARSIKAAYYATISFIDYNIGRILDSLGSDIDNTLIIFSSDHGEMLGDFGCYGKRNMLDPSARIPMIARLPGKFPADHSCSNPTTLLDLYPTFLSTAGEEDNQPSPEGIRLDDAIKETAEDRIVFSQFSMGQLGLYMATNQNWKYIYSAADKKEWLYDLANDPQETKNRINDPDCQVHLQLLKNACMTRFLEDGYTGPVEANDWKPFPIAELPEPSSDDGLLFQDPDSLDEQIKKLGVYQRSTDFKEDAQYGLLQCLYDMAKPKD